MIHSNGWRAALVTVALAGLVAGCVDNAKQSTDGRLAEPALSLPASEPEDISNSARPLDAYGVSDDDSAVIFQALQKLLQDCMTKKGFTYKVEQLPTGAAQSAAWIDPDNLGLISATAAARTGYHRPSAQGKPDQGTAGNLPAQADDYKVALNGFATPPADGTQPKSRGCRGEADTRLRGDDKAGNGGTTNVVLVDQLRQRSYDAAVADSRIKAGKASWSTCMSKKGYKYAAPAEASAAAWPDPPSRTELDTAVADMACKKEAKLLGTWDALISAYQTALIKKNEAGLQGVKEAVAARVTRAKAILGGRE